MSFINLTKVAAPSTPSANSNELYVDTTDRKLKQLDDNGVISILPHDGLHDRNILTNGGFNIQQRLATAATDIVGISTTTRGGVVADCWSVTATSAAAGGKWAQIDTAGTQETGLQARYYGSMVLSATARKMMLSQFILSSEMSHLRGKKVRVSLKHNQKVGSGQTYKLGLIQLQNTGTTDAPPAFLSGAWSASTGVDPTWNTNTAAITPDASPTGENGTITGNYLNITSVAATWTRSSCVFTVPTSAKGLYVVFFADATGGTTDNISIAEFQLTEGAEIVEYVEPPQAETLIRCQRRFCKTFALTTVPAQNVGINSGELKWTKVVAGATAGRAQWQFPVQMWKTPVTITTYNPAAANAQVRDETNTVDCASTTIVGTTDRQTGITYTGNAATVAEGLMGLHITADAEIVA
jgi:hypothetical protein